MLWANDDLIDGETRKTVERNRPILEEVHGDPLRGLYQCDGQGSDKNSREFHAACANTEVVRIVESLRDR